MSDRIGMNAVSATVQLSHGDFAVLRLQQRPDSDAFLLTLFRTTTGWRVGGEHAASVNGKSGDGVIASGADASEILRVLGEYYCAVEAGDATPLARLFDVTWRMSNLTKSGALVSEDMTAFARRIDGTPWPGYASDRHVTDLKLIHGRLACVRVERPSTGGVTVFIFTRVGDRWMIAEKAWSDGVGE